MIKHHIKPNAMHGVIFISVFQNHASRMKVKALSFAV
jgi:hypothetical protein